MPGPSFAAPSRRFGALVALLFVAACNSDSLLTPSGAGRDVVPPPPPPHYPILFVHGFNASAATWLTMVGRFKTDGYTEQELVNFSYDYRRATRPRRRRSPGRSTRCCSRRAHTTWTSSHTRWAHSRRATDVRNLAVGDRRVDAVVDLGGTNHGTITAFGCTPISCTEMRPYSTFVTKLNATDETWGTPRYATWWSGCDEVIYPADEREAVRGGEHADGLPEAQ